MFTFIVNIIIGSVLLTRKVFPHFGMRKRLSIIKDQGPWWESPDMVFNAEYIWEDETLPALQYCLLKDD